VAISSEPHSSMCKCAIPRQPVGSNTTPICRCQQALGRFLSSQPSAFLGQLASNEVEGVQRGDNPPSAPSKRWLPSGHRSAKQTPWVGRPYERVHRLSPALAHNAQPEHPCLAWRSLRRAASSDSTCVRWRGEDVINILYRAAPDPDRATTPMMERQRANREARDQPRPQRGSTGAHGIARRAHSLPSGLGALTDYD
jgi:hypothetical protein